MVSNTCGQVISEEEKTKTDKSRVPQKLNKRQEHDKLSNFFTKFGLSNNLKF